MEETIILGELALDGSVREVKGIFSMLLNAKELGIKNAIIPFNNMEEANIIEGLNLYPVKTLKEAIDAAEGKKAYVVSEGRFNFDTSDDETIDFSDVKGQEYAKRAAMIAAAGGHNFIMIGAPGCGKTFIAERFAEQASYNYQYVKSSDLASTYLHGSQEKIASLFDEARKNAPTILCFDEFDALVPRRDDINNASQSAEVNEFLSQLNNCGKDGVFVIATTNRPDKIDSAILRTGRIDYMIYVPIPDEKAREAMFRLALKNKPIDNDIDYTYLSQNTDGYLSSDISAIVYDAARMAFREKVPISMSLLKNALASRKPSLSRRIERTWK